MQRWIPVLHAAVVTRADEFPRSIKDRSSDRDAPFSQSCAGLRQRNCEHCRMIEMCIRDRPIGTYTLTFTHEGFESEKVPSITVQADRTATVNATLPVGKVGTVVEVDATPLMNAVDTTNGYVLEKEQIDAVPLPTGSFTGLAILSPGVNAELPGGTGANSGLGNQPIWANGQRDTSNSFLLNGVDASNLFNGKSTSQVASARICLLYTSRCV